MKRTKIKTILFWIENFLADLTYKGCVDNQKFTREISM